MLDSQFIDYLARESEFVQRKAKLDGERFATMMVFAQGSLADTSLVALCEDFQYTNSEKLTKQSLQERINDRAAIFLKMLLEAVIAQQINSNNFKELLPSLKNIKIKDSSSYQVPEHLRDLFPGSGGSTSEACVKIQFEYELRSGKIIDLSIGGFTTTDIVNSHNTLDDIQADDLLIRDLGYVDLSLLNIIQKKGAFFLNRIKSNVSVWIKNKTGVFEPLPLAKIEKQMRHQQIATKEFDVYLGKEKSVACRLIIECLPAEVREQKHRKAIKTAKKKGRTLGQDTIARIGLNLFVTNLCVEELPMKNVWPLYRLRWQIELVFKVFKTVAQIDKIKKVNRYRFVCYLYGKLLWVLLGWNVYWKLNQGARALGKTISFQKVMKNFKTLCLYLKTCDGLNKDGLSKIYLFVESVFKNCLLERRKGKLSSVEIIEQLCKN